MSWINSRQFQISNRNGRHYVFRRNSAGNTEINIPKTITTKADAVRWLRAHPEKVTKPKKARRLRDPAFDPFAPVFPYNTRYSPNRFFTYTSPTYAGAMKRNSPNVGSPRTNMKPSNFKKNLKKLEKIGAGRQGVAYRAVQGKKVFVLKVAPYDKLSKSRGELQPADVEYKIHDACQSVAPEGVVKVYSQIHALDFVPVSNLRNVKNLNKPHFELSKQNIIVMELCSGGSLEKWFNEHKPTDVLMKRIIFQVLTTIHKIMEKYPDFRHNDLHLENIFVSRARGFLIADFGWARLKDKGTNPAVNTANGTQTASHYGVGPKTNARYDMHLFLNNIRTVCTKNAGYTPETLKFLNAVLPVGYRGNTDTHVSDFRLKYDDPCPDLPTLTKVLGHPYFKGSPMLKKSRSMVRKMEPANAKLVPPTPRKYTNTELVALTRNQLFKLSPATRTRAVKLRANAPKLANVKKVASNATARVKTGMRQGPVKVKLVAIPKNLLKDPQFTKMWLKIRGTLEPSSGETVYNTNIRARNMARNIIRGRLNKGQSPFSSPKTGRIKIRAPNSGRLVYANGASVSLQYLKNFAKTHGVDIKGLRTKTAIAEKLFR